MNTMMINRDGVIKQVSRIAGMDVLGEIQSIEKSLGFELLPWQIYYLYTGTVRQTGFTTVYIIKMLTKESTPLDFRKRDIVIKHMDRINGSNYDGFFRSETIKIYESLKTRGIKTRVLLY